MEEWAKGIAVPQWDGAMFATPLKTTLLALRDMMLLLKVAQKKFSPLALSSCFLPPHFPVQTHTQNLSHKEFLQHET